MTITTHSVACAALVALALATVGCSSDTTVAPLTAVEAVDAPDAAGPEAEVEVEADVGAVDSGPPPPTDLELVEADLTPYEGWSSGAFVREITDPSDLLDGDSVTGAVGDWLVGNDVARFVVQASDRHSGPCPWGGNVIDASRVGPDGATYDVLGELCPFLQLGRTLRARQFDVLADGSDGPAILAVTGESTVLDFINLQSLIAEYVGTSIQLPFDPDREIPLRITVYYVLGGDSPALRVVTAVENEGAEPLTITFGEIADSGGVVQFFNPGSSLGGFGYESLQPELVDFLAFVGARGSVALVPDGVASYLAISGVAGVAYGVDDILATLTLPEAVIADAKGMVTLGPGETASHGKWIVTGGAQATSLTDAIHAVRGHETGAITVTVKDTTGAAVPSYSVALVRDGATHARGTTGVDGTFTANVTPGTWTARANPRARRVLSAPEVEVTAGATGVVEATVEPQGTLRVTIADPAGAPVPAKVVLLCTEQCPPAATSRDRDVSFDALPGDVRAVAFGSVDGEVTLALPSGEYRVVVSRGPTWSVWPDNDLSGAPVTVLAGAETALAAVIEEAVPTPGWVSGDLHVHAINSPDSPISNELRVRTMLAEGVDVLVSTDHDFITDFQPTVDTMGAGHELATVPGEELTTFDYGHFNGFPVQVLADDLNGGARDWGKGEELGMHPAEIFAALAQDPGEQVVQVNHPASGYFALVRWDANTDATYAEAERFRIGGVETDPATGDTGLWSPDFTAVELLNGTSKSRFYELAGWWFTLLSRGLHRSGTAVSDTHSSVASASGGARTWVYVGEDHDTPETFDAQVFASAINAGRAFGAIGPFVRYTAWDGHSLSAGPGDTITTPAGGGAINFVAQVRVPLWMAFDRVHLVGNVTGAAPEPGSPPPLSVTPIATQEVTLTDDDLVDGRYYERSITFERGVTEDGWYIVLVDGSGEATPSMFPVVPSKGARPFAFTNPIYVDVGADGWTPPQATAIPTARKPGPAHTRAEPAQHLDRAGAAALLEQLRAHH